ncbi:unnamed protein product [Rodentolepis nana]|uniref:Protein MNN4-like n=1 Tax=Rodentolepis nana TaxID=102285 RepID=A0A0R3TLL8_RODNA|nr:unnamed protein product [Rodentolepis nana]
MGNHVSTSHRVFRFTRRRRVRKEQPTKVEEAVGGRENREDNTGNKNSHSVRECQALEWQCEKHEEIGERTNRMGEVETSAEAVEKKEEEEGEEEFESRKDENEDEDNECSSSLREFLMLEKLCEECVETEEKKNKKNRIEERKVEEEIESRDDDADDSECSSSLMEFLILERLCEEHEEAKQRKIRREQEKIDMEFEKFREHQLSTIEEEEEEEEEEGEELEDDVEDEEEREGDKMVREVGEKCERLDDFHGGEESKYAASGDSHRMQQGEKLMPFEEFCGETFEVSPTFFQAILEEMNEVGGALEKEWKGNEESDGHSKQKHLLLKALSEDQ